MKWKMGLFAATLAAGGLAGFTGGCGGDDCSRAADHANACLNIPTSTASASATTGGQPATECTGLTACAATCINNANCEEISAAHETPPGPLADTLLACEQTCELENGINTAALDPAPSISTQPGS